MGRELARRTDSRKSRPAMVTALLRAFADLSSPALRRVVALGMVLAILILAALWTGVAIALDHTRLFGWGPLDWAVDLLGAVAVIALSWLVFPAVATLVMGFFLERVAGAVEARNY